jgi:hypothetical protein
MNTDFNTLRSREKWDTYKQMTGEWRCPACKEVDTGGPQRCSPFPGAERACGNCDYVLTRRTGGGQCDPFNWELVTKGNDMREEKIECRRLSEAVLKASEKKLFHSRARRLLRYYAENILGLPKEAYTVSSCHGGPAVPGEAILHTDTLYVQIIGGITQWGDCDGMPRVMYRACKGRKDYSGGQNRWCGVMQVADITVPNK